MSSKIDSKMSSHTIGSGKYTVDREIGKGSFAIVYRGHLSDSDNNNNLAIKAVSRSKLKNKKLLENLEIEIAILKKIKHSHIVSMIDCERTDTDFYLVMEYCALGDLTFLIKKRKELMKNHPLLREIFNAYPPPRMDQNGLHFAFILHFLQQLASALKFLRNKNLVHRDIKPQNLLLSTPFSNYTDSKTFYSLGYVGIYNLPILKIADFGFARFLPNSSMAETLCGSPLYMAPEILNYQKYNAKADLWSVGTVLFEMGAGHPPFKAQNHLELYKKIKRANDFINFPDYFSTNGLNIKEIPNLNNDLKELICNLLTFNPYDRVSFDEFFNNKLVNQDLSYFELDNNNSVALENKSKDIVESNLFVSEFLPSNKKLRGGQNANFESPTNQYDNKKIINENFKTNNNGLPNNLINIDNNTNNDQRVLTNFDRTVITDGITPNDNPNALNLSNHSTYNNDNNSTSVNNNYNRIAKKSDRVTNSDLILEREYVVVEKKTVEVNELADEFAQMGPKLAEENSIKTDLNSNLDENTNYRNHYKKNVPNNNTIKPNNSKDTNINLNNMTNNQARRYSLDSRRSSLTDYKLPLLNPSNALSRALGIASTRLFGNNENSNTNNNENVNTNENTDNNTYLYPNSMFNTQIFKDLTENVVLKTDDIVDLNVDNIHDRKIIINKLEQIAARAFVVYSYAEVKFVQIVPLPFKSRNRLSTGSCAIEEDEENYCIDNNNNSNHRETKNNCTANNGGLDTKKEEKYTQNFDLYSNLRMSKELRLVCRESVTLYLKALSLLGQAMHITSSWWYGSNDKSCSLKLNLLVQWIRDKFNECLEKADFLRLKLLESKGTDHSIPSKISLGDPTDDNIEANDEEEVYIEKLLYDRALEISKNAAKMELNHGNLNSCELSYATAMWMLQTALENHSEMSSGLDDQDKQIIMKYIASIRNRLNCIRDKIDHHIEK